MVTTNQKSIIKTHTKKRKEPKITVKIVIKSQGRKQKKNNQKITTKAIPKQLTKWQ